MDRGLDRSLDEILGDRKQNGGGRGGSRGGRRGDRGDRGDRPNYPRDGVRKPFRDDAPRNLDSEWVHDRFEDYGSRRSTPRRRHSPDAFGSQGSKLRVDNIHYELTQDDLESQGLFSRIGPLVKIDMKYDRAGRSEGTAFVTYESHHDAAQAIKEYDGANAAGQPIHLTLLPTGPRRNPFDSAVAPGRPIAERITIPGGGRSRSLSPPRRREGGEGGRRDGDRYRPGGSGGGRLSRSRSPLPGRRRDGGRGGRRSGGRRDGGGGGGGGGRGRAERGGGGGGGGRDGGRPRKTQEELDAEMDNYFAGGADAQQGEGASGAGGGDGAQQQQQQQAFEDVDMIE
ncbi:RNA-binding domain-containing protein [Trichocladium antarcticum]|uniref:RNA-binding domain-containing protein n=1 Tax=Trichocladium antarcticum TaxID=1450529 RepID=A0AAN6UD51_9PEZI|nr:RNA-binding domain-containing protein [Trichocladium antarcticum]